MFTLAATPAVAAKRKGGLLVKYILLSLLVASAGAMAVFAGHASGSPEVPAGVSSGRSAPPFWLLMTREGPSPRGSHAVAWDAARGRIVLFGGDGMMDGRVESLGDTWEWDGSTWHRAATTGPSPRESHAMTYDITRARTVLFGGETETSGDDFVSLGDTWEWDGTQWHHVASAGPQSRQGHAMVYDAARGVTVLFGGSADDDGDDVVLGDTWTWNGSQWQQAHVSGPAARVLHAMAYDSLRQRVVLYGGWSGSVPLGDTWEWDGAQWQQVSLAGPSVRALHAMTYDSTRGVTVLFGGAGVPAGAFTLLEDTWEWDGTQWTQVGTIAAPSPRGRPAMAFDGARARTLLFGGFTAVEFIHGFESFARDTWEFGTREPVFPPEIAETLLGQRALPVLERFLLGDRNADRIWDAADLLPPVR